MKDKIEQIIEDIMALPEQTSTSSEMYYYEDSNGANMGYPDYYGANNLNVEKLVTLATEILRLREAQAAAEECVGHYADKKNWRYAVELGGKDKVYGPFGVDGYDHAVKAQAEIKKILEEE